MKNGFDGNKTNILEIDKEGLARSPAEKWVGKII